MFAKYEVPLEFDLLSIDVDYEDLFVWKSIDAKYRPRVVIIEVRCGTRGVPITDLAAALPAAALTAAALAAAAPRCPQYNGRIPVDESMTVDPTDPQRWTTVSVFARVVSMLCECILSTTMLPLSLLQTVYQGASFRAMYYMGLHKGYTAVATDRIGVNIFFIRDDILACQGVKVRA